MSSYIPRALTKEYRERLQRRLEKWTGPNTPISINDALTLLRYVETLEKEVDWLAEHCEGKDQCPYMAFQWGDPPDNKRPDWCVCTDTQEDGFDCDEDPVECWRKAARKAVEAQCKSN